MAEHSIPSSTYRLGVYLGVASISAFFIALVLAYALILPSHSTGVRVRLPAEVWLGTILLAASSVAIERARNRLQRAKVAEYRRDMIFTLACGTGFVAAQGMAWWDVIGQGIRIEANPSGSAFFVFSGLHAVHVLGGLAALAWVLSRAKSMRETDEAALRKARVRTAAAAVYWHFMGALWLALLTFLVIWASNSV